MIRFPCKCGRQIEVPDSEAGGVIQCEQCGLLRDIPDPNEPADDEGVGISPSLEFGAEENTDEDGEVPETPRAPVLGYAAPHVEDGNATPLSDKVLERVTGRRREHRTPILPINRPYDLPPGARPLVDEIPPHLRVLRPGKPLGQPVQVPQHVPQLPPARGAAVTLTYASGAPGDSPTRDRAVIVELFRPANLVVASTVLTIFVLVQLLSVFTFFGIIFLLPFSVVLLLVVAAHYVNSLEDLTLEAKHELPTVFRDVNFIEDLALPLWRLFWTTSVCFGPGLALLRADPTLTDPLIRATGVILLLTGILAYPAVLLTAVAGEHWVNLAPHRLINLAASQPFRYLGSILLGLTGVAAWAAGLYFLLDLTARTSTWTWGTSGLPAWASALLTYPLLALSVFLLHGFAWTLARVYVYGHPRFGWAFQHHVSTRKDPVKQLELARAAKAVGRSEAS